MDVKKLDWDNIKVGNESNLIMTYLTFLYVHSLISKGTKVEDLKLTYQNEAKVTDVGFKEFLSRLTALNFKVSELTTKELATINTITNYLNT